MQAEQQDNFANRDVQTKDFIQQVQAGYTKLENLIRSETVALRGCTATEAPNTRDHVTAEVSKIAGLHTLQLNESVAELQTFIDQYCAWHKNLIRRRIKGVGSTIRPYQCFGLKLCTHNKFAMCNLFWCGSLDKRPLHEEIRSQTRRKEHPAVNSTLDRSCCNHKPHEDANSCENLVTSAPYFNLIKGQYRHMKES